MTIQSLFAGVDTGEQSTARSVVQSNATTIRAEKLVPWIVGGLVVIVALFVVSKL